MESQKESFICSICGISFSSLSNLRKHTRKFHTENFQLIFGSTSVRNDKNTVKYKNQLGDRQNNIHVLIVCKECDKTFSKQSNLKKHVRHFHADKLNILAPNKEYNHKCEQCGKQFTHLSDFKSHKRLHQEPRPANKNNENSSFKCPLCSQVEVNHKAIIVHFQTNHDLNVETETLEFQSKEEFHEWKSRIEKNTTSFFSLVYTKNNGDCRSWKYLCHRSGSYNCRGEGLRQIKTQGSNKIGSYCPASLMIKAKDEKYTVLYTTTHIGHEMDLGHISLSDSERKEIASKMAAKMPISAILDDIRDSHTNCNLERIHLLTKKDLYNIKQEYNLTAVEHSNDVLSVETCIKEMSNDVLHYPSLAKNYQQNKQQRKTNIQEENPSHIYGSKLDDNVPNIVEALSKKSAEDDNLIAEQDKLSAVVTSAIKSTTSFEELNALKRITLTINPVLSALRQKEQNQIPPKKSISRKRKIEPQRRFYNKKTKKRDAPTNGLKKPSAEEANFLAAKLLYASESSAR